MVVAGVKGSLAAGIDLIYDTLMVAGARRGVDRIRPARRSGQPSGRFFLRHLSAARQCPLARRQAGDAGRRDLLASRPSRRTTRSCRPTTATSPRRRRPASATSPSPSTAPAIANCRRSSASSPCCRSTGGKAPTRPATKRDIAATTLEPPLGSGAYRVKEFVPGRTIVYERVPDYWGKDLNVNIGRDNFDELRYEYFRDSDGRARGLQGRRDRLAHREQRQELGDRLRLPRGEGQARRAGGIPDPQLRRDAGLRLQHPPRQVPGLRACAAPSTSRSISRR